MAFDPTPDATSYALGELARINATILREGISGAAGSYHGSPLKTFRTILTEHSLLNKRIDILKMDVEYAEWDIFDNILSEGCTLLKHVDQLLVEFHLGNTNGPPEPGSFALRYKELMTRILACGFRMFYRDNNPSVVCCSEIALVSEAFLARNTID